MNGFTFYVRKVAAVVLILLAVASALYGLWLLAKTRSGWSVVWVVVVPVVLISLLDEFFVDQGEGGEVKSWRRFGKRVACALVLLAGTTAFPWLMMGGIDGDSWTLRVAGLAVVPLTLRACCWISGDKY